MYGSRYTCKIIAIWLTVIFFATAIMPVFADNATSTSFMTKSTVTDSYGNSGTSTSFYSIDTVGQTATGESTSTSFLMDAGFSYFDSFLPQSEQWRWYDDEASETPVTALAGESVAPSNVLNLNIIKLRMAIAETAGIGAQGVKFYLQYSTSSDFSTGAYRVVEQSNCMASSTWCYANGAGVDNGIITTKVLSDANTCSGSVGNGCGTHNESGTSTSAFTHLASAVTEYEFTIQESGANANTVYFFRAFNTIDGIPVGLKGASSYPSLSTEGATLSFTIGGLSTTTVTGGVTTSINTSSTNVPFGTIAPAIPVLGAQRLTVTTNASQGYEIYAYQQQGLLDEHASEITPVSGTNGSPAAWSSACLAASTGCYGYHTNESVLAGGSTRFAADDTYAQFSSNPNEIAYSVGPATNRSCLTGWTCPSRRAPPSRS